MKLDKINVLKLSILITTSVIFAFFLTNQAFACGPFSSRYIYTPQDIEEEGNPFIFTDINSFLDSKYEIIISGWGPRSLYFIYRDLTDNKITSEEKDHLYRYYNQEYYDTNKQIDEAILVWKKARELITKEDVEVWNYSCRGYSCYTNCLPNTFLTAANTLKERSKTYNNAQLQIWLEGQDEVFSNCGESEVYGLESSFLASAQDSLDNQGFFAKIREFFVKLFNKIVEIFRRIFGKRSSEPKEIIDPDELLGYDQKYQQAAIAFYQGDLDKAEEIFKEISENKKNPWQSYASLSLGRVYIRNAWLAYSEFQDKCTWGNFSQCEWDALRSREPYFEKAKVIFENILEDDSLNLAHQGAKALLNYVNFRIDPNKRFKDAEKDLLISRNPREIINSLEDFTLLFPEMEAEYILENGGDLSQWIYTWTESSENNLEFCLQKYQETKSLPWLLSSLRIMTVNHSQRDTIIQESSKISKASPAYFTLNYYRLKLLIKMGGNNEQLRKDIDDMLKTIPKEYFMTTNYFNDLRMIVFKNLKESLLYSLRKVVAVYTYEKFQFTDNNYLIDKKVKQLFNESLSLKKWVEISLTNDIFPPEIIKQIRLTTFLRAILLDEFEAARSIAEILASNDSVLKEDLSNFLGAKSYDEKKFSTAIFFLKYSRLSHMLDERLDEILIEKASVKERDIYGDNWWCDTYYKQYDINGLTKFISSEDAEVAKSENQKIYEIIAPNYLSEIVIDYALKNPNDSRVPEALHSTVMLTRHARCGDSKTTSFSQRAFQVLHDRYPNNYWTKQTPYWY